MGDRIIAFYDTGTVEQRSNQLVLGSNLKLSGRDHFSKKAGIPGIRLISWNGQMSKDHRG